MFHVGAETDFQLLLTEGFEEGDEEREGKQQA